MKNIRFLIKILGVTMLTTINLATIVSCDFSCISFLRTVLKVSNLNPIYIGSSNTPPVASLIAKAIKNQNPDIDISAITISNINTTSAKVTGDNKKYSGEIDVNFTVTNFQLMQGIGITEKISAISVNSTGIVYAGFTSANGTTGGVYRSDGSSNFQLMPGLNEPVSTISVNSTGVVYVGISNTSLGTGAVYKSNGTSTFQLMQGITQEVSAITVDSTDIVYAGTNNGIYKSDGTSTFQLMPGLNQPVSTITVDSTGIVYAGTNNSIYTSDGTNAFQLVQRFNDAVSTITINSADTVYIGTKNYVYKSEKNVT